MFSRLPRPADDPTRGEAPSTSSSARGVDPRITRLRTAATGLAVGGLAIMAVAGSGSTALTGGVRDVTRPAGESGAAPGLPEATIEAPPEQPGRIPSIVPNGVAVPGVGRLSENRVTDIPAAALASYHRAASVISAASPTCNLDWTLLAATGLVLSGHGEGNGVRTLDADGRVTPALIGPALRSSDGQFLADTDAGSVDGDAARDRPVGPMLIAPSSWSVVGVDGDGDGVRDPQDVDDASLAQAVNLCAEDVDLTSTRDLATALARIDPGAEFAEAVLAAKAGYDVAPAPTTIATFTTVSAESSEPKRSDAVAPGPQVDGTAARADGKDGEADAAPASAGQDTTFVPPTKPTPQEPTEPVNPEAPADPVDPETPSDGDPAAPAEPDTCVESDLVDPSAESDVTDPDHDPVCDEPETEHTEPAATTP